MDKINFVYKVIVPEQTTETRAIKLPWELYKFLKDLSLDGETCAYHFREITQHLSFSHRTIRGKKIQVQNPSEIRKALWAAYRKKIAKDKKKAGKKKAS